MNNFDLISLNNLITHYEESENKINQLNQIGSILQEHAELSEKIAGIFYTHIISTPHGETEQNCINLLMEKNLRLQYDIEIIKSIESDDTRKLEHLLIDYQGHLEEIEIDLDQNQPKSQIKENLPKIQRLEILNYALSKNEEIAKLLIKKLSVDGSIDFQDKAGNTLIMTCLLEGKNDLAKFLLQNGANPLQKNLKSISPFLYSIIYDKNDIVDEIFKLHKTLELPNSDLLIYCIDKKKHHFLQRLAKQTNAINLPASNLMTPLISAVNNEDHRAMKILLTSGANPEMKFRGKMAIDYALQKSPETLEVLISVSIESENETAIIYKKIKYLKIHQPENYKEKLKVLEKFFPYEVGTYKELFSRKRVAHASSLAGTTEFQNKNEIHSIQLEGFKGPRPFYRRTAKLLEQKSKEENTLPIKKEKIKSYIETFNKGASELTPEKIEMIKKGEDVLISGGFEGHSISFLITTPNKNSSIRHFIICNRGAGMEDTPIDVYKFDVNNLNESLINSFKTAKESDGKHYKNIFLPEMDKKLGLIKGDFEDQLSNLCKLDKQTVGNCTLANTEAALLALMIYDTIRSEIGFQNLNNKKSLLRLKEINDFYNEFIASSEIDYLDKYVQKHLTKELYQKMDYPLVLRSLSNFYCLRKVYQNNIDKLIAIEKNLLKIISRKEQENIKTCKIYFTTESEVVDFSTKFEKNKYYTQLKDVTHDILLFYKATILTLSKNHNTEKIQENFKNDIKNLLNEVEKIPTYIWQEKSIQKVQSDLEQLNEKYRKIIKTLIKKNTPLDI